MKIQVIDRKQQQGFTLVELMIAMMLGVFLLAGIIQTFIGSRQSYRLQENMSRLQENGRFAMHFIGQGIRMADYHKCHTTPSVSTAISGNNDAGLNGSDDVTITKLTNDCGATDVTETTKYLVQAGTTGAVPGLFRKIGTNPAQELVEGVENIQILYGVDTDESKSPNYYVAAGTTGLDYSKVISVSVSLLMQSIDDNVTPNSITYTYNGSSVTPTDKRKRQVFSSTIALRNRLP